MLTLRDFGASLIHHARGAVLGDLMTSHKKVVIPDAPRSGWGRAKLSLSRMWRRDAEFLRRKALKAERRASVAVSKSWRRLRPKVVHVEHRMHDSLLAALHRFRPHT